MSQDSDWTVEKSEAVYRIGRWGEPYFSTNEKGHVVVCPNGEPQQSVDLYQLVEGIRERGVQLPVLLRFPDILEARIRLLNESFQRAIEEYKYDGSYRGVYPIKVNQQRHLVEEVVNRGRPWRFGLEVGSRPELLIALAATEGEPGFLVCNGYKDRGYIETALLAQQLGNEVFIVIEQARELQLIQKAAEKIGLPPQLGVRAKLSSKGVGRWASSSGDRAKFGLTAAEVMGVVKALKESDQLACLRLLHFHIGSQVSSILPFKNAVREAGQLYAELAEMGCQMGYLDVGGGLAIDYDGSQTDFRGSRNYTVQSYAYDVVSGIQDACQKMKVQVPTIVSESGRALTAHQSVLLFEAIGEDKVRFGTPEEPVKDDHRLIHEVYETWHSVSPENLQESWHDGVQVRDEARSLFRLGYLRLPELARVEKLFWHVAERIHDTLPQVKHIPEELQFLDELLSSIYFCNFSIFQSAPDMWAVDQLFPITPIHRLGEAPTVRARLADLTCDSDGLIDAFIDEEDVARVLPVHPLNPGEPYIFGMFLVGAYQEILGDLHNLFGDTNAVHVSLTDEGHMIDHIIPGDRVDEVFRYVQYDPEQMIEKVRRQAERSLAMGRITLPQMRKLLIHYEESLRGYTYLKDAT